MEIKRYEISANLGDYFGIPTIELDRCPSKDGEWVSVDDLKAWLDWHVRNRTIHTIYSDLSKQLTDV